jgi:L-threonylcarbamoyladenylate synthase
LNGFFKEFFFPMTAFHPSLPSPDSLENTFKKNPVCIEEGKKILRQGNLLGIPTETVYGLAANAYDGKAIEKIYALKKRPNHNPLIVHYASYQATEKDIILTPLAKKLAQAFWPGPLTLIVPKSPHSSIALACHRSYPKEVAIRVPCHPLAQALLRGLDFPLGAPSANPSGKLSPTNAFHVENYFPELPVIDGGPCKFGLESTVVHCGLEIPLLVRPGAITPEHLSQVLGHTINLWNHTNHGPSPGLLLRHYAPSKPLRMNANHFEKDEGILWFGPSATLKDFTDQGLGRFSFNLSPTENLLEAAHNLFKGLHFLDHCPCKSIAIAPVPQEGLGHAINDRLYRSCGLI